MAVAYNEAAIIVGTPAMPLDFTDLLKRARHAVVDESSIFSHVDAHSLLSLAQLESLISIGDTHQLSPFRSIELRKFPKFNSCSLANHPISHALPLSTNMFQVYRSHPEIVQTLSYAASTFLLPSPLKTVRKSSPLLSHFLRKNTPSC